MEKARRAWAGAGLLLLGAWGLRAGSLEGALFLELPAGARAAALGGAYGPLAEGAEAAVWNPAGLGFAGGVELALYSASGVEDVRHGLAGVSVPLGGRGALAAAVQYWDSGDIESADEAGNPLPDFSAQDAAYTLAYGRSWPGGLALGAAVKSVALKIGDARASAAAADAGLLYRVSRAWTLSLAAANWGGPVRFDGEEESLPRQYRAGAAWRPTASLTVSIEAARRAVSGDARGHAGLEWRPAAPLVLRAGHRAGDGAGGSANLSAGLGLSWGRYEAGYAWNAQEDLGDTHSFSLRIRLGRARKFP